jgi:hypothetical protein
MGMALAIRKGCGLAKVHGQKFPLFLPNYLKSGGYSTEQLELDFLAPEFESWLCQFDHMHPSVMR